LGFKDNVPALDYGRILLTRVATHTRRPTSPRINSPVTRRATDSLKRRMSTS
jgi:hypothetical protein